MTKVLGMLALMFALVTPALAQKDKQAQDILDAMSKQYKSLKAYQAAFTYASTGGQGYKGDLAVKGGKFRMLMGGQEVYNDGKTMATYLKETNEVNLQDPATAGSGELNPTQIYNLYKRGFNYKFLKEQQQGGRTVEVIELTPTKAKSPIKSIQMSVDKADKSVRNWLILNKDGKRETYTITKFTPNASIPDAAFVFDQAKHPGVEVVDLR